MGKLLTPKGDVKKLIVYRKAELLYDLTYYFCHTFLSPKDRTIDQMIQAARSGKQNIAEGNSAGISIPFLFAIAYANLSCKQTDILRNSDVAKSGVTTAQNQSIFSTKPNKL